MTYALKVKQKKSGKKLKDIYKEYIGKYYEISETAEKIYIGKDFPDEFAHGKDKTVLKGPNLKAKANAAQAVGELIQIAENKSTSEEILTTNMAIKLNMDGIVMIHDWHCLSTMMSVSCKGIIFIN